jgi:hypothetical protein
MSNPTEDTTQVRISKHMRHLLKMLAAAKDQTQRETLEALIAEEAAKLKQPRPINEKG